MICLFNHTQICILVIMFLYKMTEELDDMA